jgi:hypothetical protein
VAVGVETTAPITNSTLALSRALLSLSRPMLTERKHPATTPHPQFGRRARVRAAAASGRRTAARRKTGRRSCNRESNPRDPQPQPVLSPTESMRTQRHSYQHRRADCNRGRRRAPPPSVRRVDRLQRRRRHQHVVEDIGVSGRALRRARAADARAAQQQQRQQRRATVAQHPAARSSWPSPCASH